MRHFTKAGWEITDLYLIKLLMAIKSKHHSIIVNNVGDGNPNKLKFYRANIDVIDSMECFIISIKFYGSYRRIKIFVNKDEEISTLEIMYIEKTRNIVENIDCINQVIDRKYCEKNDFIPKYCNDIFSWGYTRDETRKNDIFKVHGINLDHCPINDNGTITLDATDKLYFGIIESTVLLANVLDLINVNIIFVGGRSITIVTSANKFGIMTKGNIFISNYAGKHNIMAYIHSKKHLIFDPVDIAKINTYKPSGKVTSTQHIN